MEEIEKFKRLPAEEKPLDELTGIEKRVAVIGTVSSLDKEKMKGVLADGKTEAVLLFSGEEKLALAKEKSTVRVIGKPEAGEKVSIAVESIHELEGFDRALFDRVRSAEKKVLK